MNLGLRRRIAILASNPMREAFLRTDREMREIEESLRSSERRDYFEVRQLSALRPNDLQRVLLEFEPHIVHFCGHSSKKGLILEDDRGKPQEVPGEALADLFRIVAARGTFTECVILNACYTEAQAEMIAAHVSYVIGMSAALPDGAAIDFARGFYDTLGAGKSIETAFEFGCNRLQLKNRLEASRLPALRHGLNRTHRDRDLADATTLSRMSKDEVKGRLNELRRAMQEVTADWETHLYVGLLYLRLRLFAEAQSYFERAVKLSPESAAAHYYLALALVGGKRPKYLSPDDCAQVEHHLTVAAQIDPEDSKYFYLLAIIKYDFYFTNGLRSRSPSYDELLRQARQKLYDRGEMERLLEIVVVHDRELVAILRRER